MPEITPENRLPEERAKKYFVELILGLEYCKFVDIFLILLKQVLFNSALSKNYSS